MTDFHNNKPIFTIMQAVCTELFFVLPLRQENSYLWKSRFIQLRI
ncbi:hypothetical protein l11_08920 [Neisseria weaveri LMG 5135]|nr:hypothetical protein l13_08150 [Neisseria weaveri ATCC 51223]EGV37940.1 hypothetical protein l11_08920 [Neisseria weaveri LMG 5135]